MADYYSKILGLQDAVIEWQDANEDSPKLDYGELIQSVCDYLMDDSASNPEDFLKSEDLG
jgi:hypothetical protein